MQKIFLNIIHSSLENFLNGNEKSKTENIFLISDVNDHVF